MLQRLSIQNFALIDHLELSFPKGYIGITGETGSGKSILLNALGLLIGDRADSNVIGDLKEKSIVEGEFLVENDTINFLLEQNDIDLSFPLIIRREIAKTGKARVFINDTPVTLNVLREFGTHLVYIHSQYNTLELKNKNYQLQVLDELAGLTPVLNNYQTQFKHYQSLQKRKFELQSLLAENVKKTDYNQFILSEIEALNLEKTDYASLESEWKTLDSAGEVLFTLNQMYELIEEDNGAKSLITKLKTTIERNVKLNEQFNSFLERVQSIHIELKELGSDVLALKEGIELSPEKKFQLEEKLNHYQKVLFKHNLKSQAELEDFKNAIELELSESQDIEIELEKVNSSISKLEVQLRKEAREMHAIRLAKGIEIASQIKLILEDLKLLDTELIFDLNEEENLTINGISKLSILFSANKGIAPIEIEKAASGGELSRVMLALQYMSSKQKKLPTLFFDEIDTGVSGEVAQKIGVLLNKMGQNAQVIAISHLPQVVAKSNAHYKVLKEEKNGRVNSSVHALSEDEKINEIARLMSGSEISAEAISNAKILMNH